MTPSPPTSAADRFALIIQGLCRVIAARSAAPKSLPIWGPAVRRPLPGPFIILIWTRLRRMGARFAALAAQFHAGTLPSPRRRRPASSRSRSAAPPHRLPRRRAWLVRLAPEAACYGGQLRHLLSDPEIAALLSAAPQLGRVLRPLCRMLGIDWESISRVLPLAMTGPPAHSRAADPTSANPPHLSARDPAMERALPAPA